MNPELLFRSAERHENQVRARCSDALQDHFLVFCRLQRDTGAFRSHDARIELSPKTLRDCRRDALLSAEQVDAPTTLGRTLHQRENEV